MRTASKGAVRAITDADRNRVSSNIGRRERMNASIMSASIQSANQRKVASSSKLIFFTVCEVQATFLQLSTSTIASLSIFSQTDLTKTGSRP